MSGILVFPGGWPQIDYSDWDTDTEYEEQIKTCRAFGHDLLAEYAGGFEILTCSRCSARFEEQP